MMGPYKPNSFGQYLDDVPLVEAVDIGQTRGPEDLMEYTRPVCPGHYNHMVVSGNLTIGYWTPQRQWIDGTEEIRLAWKGNSFEIVHEPNCMYCNDSDGWHGHCDRDGVLPIQFVDKWLRR
jgi:hypothetical protein